MKQNTPALGTQLSREAMKNIKGGQLPGYVYWKCSGYPNSYVVDHTLINPETNCNPDVGTCTYYEEEVEYLVECEVVPA